MSDLAAAGVASIESLAYPLKPRSGPAADAWPAVAARDLNALQTRLVRGRVTLVPMMAAAMARAFPEDVAEDQTLALLPEVAARSAESGAEETAGGRRGKGEARLDKPGGVPEALRRRRRTRGGRHRLRTGRLSRAWRRPSPRTGRPRARGPRRRSKPFARPRRRRPISSARSPPWCASRQAPTPTSSSSRAIPSRRSKTLPASRTSSVPARCSIPRCCSPGHSRREESSHVSISADRFPSSSAASRSPPRCARRRRRPRRRTSTRGWPAP